MPNEPSDLNHLKRGVSILTTCVVQTLDESDPTYQERFLKKLSEAYREIKDNSDLQETHTLELLAWTRSLLTGFDWSSGQGKPFLED